ncbi:MAG TPA: hypothetical protein VLE43_04985 [Candidatus Saccharimonadia bacterium]|nr:hypothetical protein [Candidatus Saccharimonadia bacterium]
MKHLGIAMKRAGLAMLLALTLPSCSTTSTDFRRLKAATMEPNASNIQGRYSNLGRLPDLPQYTGNNIKLWYSLGKQKPGSLADDVVALSIVAPDQLVATLYRKGRKLETVSYTYRRRGNHLCLSDDSDVDFIKTGVGYSHSKLSIGVNGEGNLLVVSEYSVTGTVGLFLWATSGTGKSEFPRIK